MRTYLKAAIGGVAALAAVALVAGSETPAVARDSNAHTLIIQLPNGAMERIAYFGDVAPRVEYAPGSMAAAPVMAAMPGLESPFAALERASAMLDQQAAAMMQQVADMPMAGGAMTALPPGVSGYSSVTTISNGRACTRTTETRYDGGAMQPQTVSNVSGDCNGEGGPAMRQTPAALPASPVHPDNAVHTLRVKANGRAPYRHMVQEAFYQH